MKKLILFVAVVAIVAITAFNVNLNFGESKNLSSIALANIEALAQAESGKKCNTIKKTTKEYTLEYINNKWVDVVIYSTAEYSCSAGENPSCAEGTHHIDNADPSKSYNTVVVRGC